MDLQTTFLPARRPSVRAGNADPSYRVGELERVAACDALSEHYAAGRLDPAELDERLGRAVAARTRADLRVLFVDLGPQRSVPEAPATESTPVRTSAGALPYLAGVLVLSLLLAGGMLLELGTYNQLFALVALVGGLATATAGVCATVLVQAAVRRR